MKKQKIGITGNMACGKSTVSALLRQYANVKVYDSDQLGKMILNYNLIKLESFLGVLLSLENGQLDFEKLSRLVANEPALLRKVEIFLHPLLFFELSRMTDSALQGTEIDFVFIESALIYEVNWHTFFDSILVVSCGGEEVQKERIKKRNPALTSAEIDIRLQRQMSMAEKIRRADFVIDSNCSPLELQKRVESFYQSLQ